jgi:hypothetical protein
VRCTGRDEEDCDLLEARVLVHHVGELEAVDLWHAYIHQHNGDVVAKK